MDNDTIIHVGFLFWAALLSAWVLLGAKPEGFRAARRRARRKQLRSAVSISPTPAHPAAQSDPQNSARHPRPYDAHLEVIRQEQGDWYVAYFIEKELHHILDHNLAHSRKEGLVGSARDWDESSEISGSESSGDESSESGYESSESEDESSEGESSEGESSEGESSEGESSEGESSEDESSEGESSEDESSEGESSEGESSEGEDRGSEGDTKVIYKFPSSKTKDGSRYRRARRENARADCPDSISQSDEKRYRNVRSVDSAHRAPRGTEWQKKLLNAAPPPPPCSRELGDATGISGASPPRSSAPPS